MVRPVEGLEPDIDSEQSDINGPLILLYLTMLQDDVRCRLGGGNGVGTRKRRWFIRKYGPLIVHKRSSFYAASEHA